MTIDVDEHIAAPGAIDLGDRSAPRAHVPPARRMTSLVPLLALTAVLSGAAGAGAAVLASPGHAHPTPSIVLAGGGDLPTTEVWFADGTHADASEALTRAWKADRPIRMITVAAVSNCSIIVDGVLVVAESAPVNRFAVCVWTAP